MLPHRNNENSYLTIVRGGDVIDNLGDVLGGQPRANVGAADGDALIVLRLRDLGDDTVAVEDDGHCYRRNY